MMPLLAGACVASSVSLASNNALPRWVCLHVAGVVALLLLSMTSRWGRVAWLIVAVMGLVTAQAFGGHPDTRGPSLDAVSALAVTLAVAAVVGRRRTLVRLFVGVALVSAGLAFLDAFMPLNLGEATRPSGLLASRSTAGAFAVAAVALLWPTRLRWVSFTGLVPLTAFVVATRARAAWAALGVVVVAALFRERRWHTLAACGAGVFLTVVTPFPRWRWTSASPWQDSASSLARGDVGDRLDVWRSSLPLLSLQGTGVGGFEAHFPTTAFSTVRIESPHNEFVRAAVELGLGSLLVLGLTLVTMAPRRGRGASRLRWALGALLVCGLTGKTFSEPPTLVFGAVLAGLLLRPRLSRRTRVHPLRRTMTLLAGVTLAFGATKTDTAHLESSAALRRSLEFHTAGQTRAAWEVLAPTLDASRDMAPWLFAFQVLGDAGDSRQCHELAQRAAHRWPVSEFLQAAGRRCTSEH
ncbi:MAG: O-antigen ligase family protein [Myxococcaceae bacterium]|nr:O-antigen ligase family protein [Myxococcaceae bacterium]